MSPDAMAANWYYAKQGAPSGQQFGPLAWQQLYSLAQAGTLAPGDVVWHPSLPQWTSAAQITGLFPAAPQPPAQWAAAQPSAQWAAQPGAAYQASPAPPAAESKPRSFQFLPTVITLFERADRRRHGRPWKFRGSMK
jgi:hypothetical protein